jgi:hypothetical protein
VKEATICLYGIKIIQKYFNLEEKKIFIYFSKLYYGSEVWHIPGLNNQQKKQLNSASAAALKICTPNLTVFPNNTRIHHETKRAC